MVSMQPDAGTCSPPAAAGGGGGGTSSSTASIVATTVFATVSVLFFLRYVLYPLRPSVLHGPLKTIVPRLSKEELEALPYRPDEMPGARDVMTPYGSIRVYEWGPEDGRKVLMLHGISTSSMTLSKVAHGLVSKGCRVLLFDLFGRGFSDGVGDLPHDPRLYVSQCLLVLASSPLSWAGRAQPPSATTGSVAAQASGFSVVAYSLGGGIAVHLAATFPHLIDSLVLLAPSGLIRSGNVGWVARAIFRGGFVPERVLAAMTRSRLRQPIAGSVKKKAAAAAAAAVKSAGAATANGAEPATKKPARRRKVATSGGFVGGYESEDDQLDAVVSPLAARAAPGEAAARDALDPAGAPPAQVAATAAEAKTAAPRTLEARVAAYVQWMLLHHHGFVPAFMSSVRHAPLTDQHDAWRKMADRAPGTTALVFGRSDELVSAEDYREDALPLVGGEEKVLWKVVRGGHDFPMSNSEGALEVIYGFWGI